MASKIKRVGGAQAEMAQRDLKMTKVTRASAKSLWDAGVPVCMVGNKVNSFHFFGGWHLAYCTDPAGREPGDFDRLANSFNAHLEPELGSRPAFFIKNADLKSKGLAGVRGRGLSAAKRSPQPTPEQMAAVQAFATKYGAHWKDRLSQAWATGADDREPNGHLLRQVRNQFGPRWLYSRGSRRLGR